MGINIRHSLALKLSLYTITCVIIIFVGVLIYNYQVSKRLILENTQKSVESLAGMTLNHVDALLIAAQKVPEDLAFFIEFSNQSKSEFLTMLRSLVESNPEIFGSTASFEPYMFSKDIEFFGPYFYKSPNGIKYTNLHTPKYDYLKWDWYNTAKNTGEGLWSEPYFDEGGGNVLMVTYSQPFYKHIDGKRLFAGVATCDIALDWLVDMISKLKIYDSGYAFLLSGKGTFIAHPNKDYYLKGLNFFKLAEKYNDPNERLIGEKMTSGQSGNMKYFSRTLDKVSYVYYQPLEETGWSLGIVIPENELYSKLQSTTLELLVIGLAGYVLTLIMIIVLANIATNPLKTLAKATQKIGKGDFNAEIPKVKSTDEIGILSSSFMAMQSNLIKYVSDLKETTSVKERIEKELSIAREIQQSILPHNFPKNNEFDIYAKLIPAREIGGDLYDFFFIDDEHLCFAIGDVSGKGVPAALFMAITKTLFRSKVNSLSTLADTVTEMNKAFCKEGDSAMFATLFTCILNIKTGQIRYCNAGHNPPVICNANDKISYLDIEEPLPPIGVIEDTQYKDYELKLNKGDMFLLYTDGITEAMSRESVQFSDEKFLEVIAANKDKNPKELTDSVLDTIRLHAKGAEQSDDITLFILKYNG